MVKNSARFVLISEATLWVAGVACFGALLILQYERRTAAETEVERFLGIQLEAPESVPLLALTGESESLLHDLDQDVAATVGISERNVSEEKAGSAIGVLRIPRLQLEVPIYPDAGDRALEQGIGWIPDTASLDSHGNVGIAGHRDSFFRPLKDIATTDVIEVVGAASTTRYQVTDTWIVEPDAVHVLDSSDEQVLTLVTCYPFYFVGHAPQRFIVRAAAIDSL